MMSAFVHDLRYAFRNLARTPAFTLIAVGTLVLGIGANTAIFSIVNAVLLEPLPYADPDRLVRIYSTSAQTETGNINPLDALDWRRDNRSFERLAIFHSDTHTVSASGEPMQVSSARVTHEFFDLLGTRPALGRAFTAAEEVPGAHHAVMLSHAFWMSTFGGSPAALSATIDVAGQPHQIVGILPPGFRSPLPARFGEPAVWRPMAIDPSQEGRGGHYMYVIARLRPGTTAETAQQELTALAAGLQRQFPDEKSGRSARLVPLRETIVGDSRKSLTLLMGAVGLILLIACTNVASLFLARSAARQRELTIRSALGAGRLRLIRQILTESLVLALVGGAASILLASWLTSVLRNAGTGIVPRLDEATLDLRVLAFTAIASLASALVFGLVPALRMSRTGVAASRAATAGRDVRGALRWMIVAEVAVSILLLAGAGLLLRSLWNVSRVEPGFDVDRILFLRVQLPAAHYTEDPQIVGFYDELQRRLERHPSIESAGATNILPLSGGFSCDGYTVEGDEEIANSLRPCAEVRAVTESYFRTMGIELLQGRTFDATDQPQSETAVVVSRSMADRIGGDVVGRRIRTGRIAEDAWGRIVGVTSDVRHFDLAREPEPELYLLTRQEPYYGMTVVARVKGEMTAAAEAMRSELRALDPALPANGLQPMSELLSGTLAERTLRASLFGMFAAVALLLAAAGIYGVVSHGVSQRNRELGIRMALGAQRDRVLRSILGESLRVVIAGVAIGTVAALAFGRLLESLLYGTTSTDPITLAGTALVLLVIALAASWAPARRATRVDPAVVLRVE